MRALRSVERTSRVTPFGVRFVDEHDGRVVADGITLRAWPSGEPSRVRTLPRTRTDVFYLSDAPGLRELTFGAGDDAYWDTVGRSLEFTFEALDAEGRFLPFRFTAELPARGLFGLRCGSPSSPAAFDSTQSAGVPLFSAPARPSSAGCVVLRADLWDALGHTPARWAVLQARTPGAAQRGEPPRRAVADHLGRVALHFPAPDPFDIDAGLFDSPAGSSAVPLPDWTWTLELQAAYSRLEYAPDTAQLIAPPIPDLCAVLGQGPALLWERLGAAPVELTRVSVRFSRDALLKSSDAGSEPPSVLLLTPVQSPP